MLQIYHKNVVFALSFNQISSYSAFLKPEILQFQDKCIIQNGR
jgi:hypothetical protein